MAIRNEILSLARHCAERGVGGLRRRHPAPRASCAGDAHAQTPGRPNQHARAADAAACAAQRPDSPSRPGLALYGVSI